MLIKHLASTYGINPVMSAIIESIIDSVKSIDHPIIDHLGQLHSRTKKNRRDEDTYSVVKDAPILRYSPIVDSRISITEVDGRLYDVKNSKYLEVHGEDEELFDLTNLSFKSVVVSAYKNMMLALTDNGDLYRATVDVTTHSFELVDNNINFITRGHQDDLVAVRGNRFSVYDEEATIHQALPEGDEVIDVQPGILITRNHLIVLRGAGSITAIKYNNRLICCGIVPIYDEGRDRDLIYLALMEGDNGELVTRFCDPDDYRAKNDIENNEDEDAVEGNDNEVEDEENSDTENNEDAIEDVNVDSGENSDAENIDNEDSDEENNIDGEVYNSQLVKMYRQSPWTEIVTINNEPHLLNRDGLTLEIREGWATIGTKIPTEILSTNNRIKSMW